MFEFTFSSAGIESRDLHTLPLNYILSRNVYLLKIWVGEVAFWRMNSAWNLLCVYLLLNGHTARCASLWHFHTFFIPADPPLHFISALLLPLAGVFRPCIPLACHMCPISLLHLPSRDPLSDFKIYTHTQTTHLYIYVWKLETSIYIWKLSLVFPSVGHSLQFTDPCIFLAVLQLSSFPPDMCALFWLSIHLLMNI